ncbi:MAG: hypothetical protein JW862_13280 [Anaerolineales bacterium]|nr:hypothetical protein [Anaerolineales bacterium]
MQTAALRLVNEWRLWRLNHQVSRQARPDPGQRPVVIFNASARLNGLSQNAAFSLLTAWGLQVAGVPVIHFVCQAGMSRCVLGTDRDDHARLPPCQSCMAQSRRLYRSAAVHGFTYAPDAALTAALVDRSLDELMHFECELPGLGNMPLGALVRPSLRWALRRHHLADDHPTRYLLRQFILSAYRVATEFEQFLQQVDPQAVVVFNGLQFPEATVRWVAQQHGLRVITHEVSFQPFSAFFTDGQATAYPMRIEPDFELSNEQNQRLDEILSRRFQGQFTMAGITFWPEISGLDQAFLEHAARFEQIVPVFTNVIFDTSQAHANVIFPNMFAWLDLVLEIIRAHPETLFVIRAHPDEMRPGKESRESVQAWVEANAVLDLPNVIFVGSRQPLSSYELIHRSKFIMVYNSSIGLEAALLGQPVLCGGKARYTQYPTVFFPDSAQDYRRLADEFLAAEQIEVPAEFVRYARRVNYFQLYRASLSFADYLEAHLTPGYVQLKPFSWQALLPEHAAVMRTLVSGITRGTPFLNE